MSNPENPNVAAQAKESMVFDEKAQEVAPGAESIAEDLPSGSPDAVEAPRFSEPKVADVEISKHERRTAIAALKIAKLEKIPARGTLKAKDIAASPEILEETLLDFVLHCHSPLPPRPAACRAAQGSLYKADKITFAIGLTLR